MEISKYNIHFTHENTTYDISLYDADKFGKKENQTSIRIGEKNYAIAGDALLPSAINNLFASLNGTTFSSDKELLEKLELSLGQTTTGLSLTKKVYDLVTQKLLSKENFNSQNAAKITKETYSQLNRCNPSEKERIANILHNSHCSPMTLFEIADTIAQEGKIELAHAIRNLSRPFDLETVINTLCTQVSSKYFNETMAQQCVAFITTQFQKGEYEKIYDPEEFTAVITEDLRRISHEGHFELILKEEEPSEKEERLVKLQKENFGFGKLHIADGVCYLEIHSMCNPKELFNDRQLAREKAQELLKKIHESHPQAVVIDLRNNHGGSSYMSELLCSYFSPPNIPLSSFAYRDQPTGTDTLYFPVEACKTWSYETLPQEERMLETPLYILTSKDTFSAAEDLTCHLKQLNNRTTVIGETTGGGANPAKLFDAGGDFYIAIPIGEVVIPYGKNWEGTGIDPDMPTDPENAYEKAQALIQNQRKK